jgi:hypothetical protein
MAAEHKSGSDPKYMTRTRNIINAAAGNETVVGRGLGLSVAARRKKMGNKHRITSIALPQGPPPVSITAHWQP